MASQTNFEITRNRIQRLVEEIGALSKKDLPSAEYFQQYIERVAQATDAKGAAVWVLSPGTEPDKQGFQLAAQVNFETSQFNTHERQREQLTKIMLDVAKTKRSFALPAQQPSNYAESGAPQNATPYPFMHVPLVANDQVAGVLQVWLQPYVAPANYGEFLTFLAQLAAHVTEHLQSRRLGTLVSEVQRLQHLLKFTTDTAGTLDLTEVARLTANYARDIVGCERCAVLVREDGQWRVSAISGQETVERKSSMVKAIAAFVGARAGEEIKVFSKKDYLARTATPVPGEAGGEELVPLEPQVDPIDLAYFEVSHVHSAAICPVRDSEKRVVAALLCESTADGFFEAPSGGGEPSQAHKLALWVTEQGGRTLVAARDYQTLPLLGVSRSLRHARSLLVGDRRRRFWSRAGIVLGIFALIALWPVSWRTESDCVMVPVDRTIVVPEIPGRVERVLVRENDAVAAGAVLARLDTDRLETELQAVVQERLRYLAEVDRHRAPPNADEASAQVAQMQANIAASRERRIRADIEKANLRTPIAGVVTTKHVELRAGEYLQPGAQFAEVASMETWELQLDVDERDIGLMEQALAKRGKLDVPYILYAQSALKLNTSVSERAQISAAAEPRDQGTFFVVTIRDPGIPADLKPLMRPGLTGRAKVDLGRFPFGYIVARKVARWFQVRFV